MTDVVLPRPWHLTAGGILVVFFIALCWLGAHRQVRGEEGRLSPRRRAALSTVALVVIACSLDGPLHRAGETWLAWHMVIHVLVMFYVPLLFVVARTADLMSSAIETQSWAPTFQRCCARVLNVSGGALVAVVLFNAAMAWWHIPGIFNWQMSNTWSTEVLMVPSFILAGSLFWRVLFGGRDGFGNPRLVVQALTVLSTAFVMLVMAMWMSIGARAPWYASTVALHGGVLALRDQHYAAGVLWVCGDLWAIPALVVIALRVVNRRGGASAMASELLGK